MCVCVCVCVCVRVCVFIYYNTIWLSLSHLVGLWQTKCGIIWSVLKIYARIII